MPPKNSSTSNASSPQLRPSSAASQPQSTSNRPPAGDSSRPPSSNAPSAAPTIQYAPINTPAEPPRARPRFLSIDSGASQRPSIRIRRFPSYASTATGTLVQDYAPGASSTNVASDIRADPDNGGRRRSNSEPQRLYLNSPEFRAQGLAPRGSQSHMQAYMPNIAEGTQAGPNAEPFPQLPPFEEGRPGSQQTSTPKRSRGRLFRSSTRGDPTNSAALSQAESEYESGLVDVLDLVDPEVSTLNTLTNVQNSLFVPQLGWLVNRRPTYTLTRRPEDQGPPPSAPQEGDQDSDYADERPQDALSRADTSASITSRPTEGHYAVLPHGINLEGWSAEDRAELNDHVRHMLHSKRSRFKRSMRGFGQYVRRPLGFFVTLYATLITLFGLAWVLFLIGWINVGGKQDYIINVIDEIMVALFAIMGDGLAPFRIVDTYHMCFIAHYHHLTWRLRKEKALPKLENKNDLPPLQPADVEAGNKDEEFSVLSPKQQKRLVHHQNKFAASHTFYKPHETTTHHAFPLRYLVAIVCLLDAHSCLQIALGSCTWAINYKHRPFALTTVILCCSITVNITAGVVIMIGDRRTRKKDVLELMHKQELTAEAMEKVKRKREREREQKRLNEELVTSPLSPDITKPSPMEPNEKYEPMTSPNGTHSSMTPTSPVSRQALPLLNVGNQKTASSIPTSPTAGGPIPQSPLGNKSL
ncbi:integral membrane protein-1 [Coleophoma cylindrospora]|uniref:Integral membrane protein-1 n=1 Tax=Coleophoma cylindrospora TaxID=1849047 RepID=A0A3D8QED1_9HELO|nr:integral membrane protein-1 [Coleophoma cylindrospora]